MELEEHERFAAASLFVLALHATQAKAAGSLDYGAWGMVPPHSVCEIMPSPESPAYLSRPPPKEAANIWGWDCVKPGGLCDAVLQRLKIPLSSWLPLKTLPEYVIDADDPNPAVFWQLINRNLSTLQAAPLSPDRAATCAQISPLPSRGNMHISNGDASGNGGNTRNSGNTSRSSSRKHRQPSRPKRQIDDNAQVALPLLFTEEDVGFSAHLQTDENENSPVEKPDEGTVDDDVDPPSPHTPKPQHDPTPSPKGLMAAHILLEACIGTPTLSSSPDTLHPHPQFFDARYRVTMKLLSTWLSVPWKRLLMMEQLMADQALHAISKASRDSSQAADTPRLGMGRYVKYAVIGAAALGGGAVLAVTGGLAAPIVVGGVGALMGAVPGGAAAGAAIAGAGTMMATSAGTGTVMASLGVAGAAHTGRKMHRRLGDVKQFGFRPLPPDDISSVNGEEFVFCESFEAWATEPDGTEDLDASMGVSRRSTGDAVELRESRSDSALCSGSGRGETASGDAGGGDDNHGRKNFSWARHRSSSTPGAVGELHGDFTKEADSAMSGKERRKGLRQHLFRKKQARSDSGGIAELDEGPELGRSSGDGFLLTDFERVMDLPQAGGKNASEWGENNDDACQHTGSTDVLEKGGQGSQVGGCTVDLDPDLDGSAGTLTVEELEEEAQLRRKAENDEALLSPSSSSTAAPAPPTHGAKSTSRTWKPKWMKKRGTNTSGTLDEEEENSSSPKVMEDLLPAPACPQRFSELKLSVVVAVCGAVSDMGDFTSVWDSLHAPGCEKYSLVWESKELQQLDNALITFVTTQAAGFAASFALKYVAYAAATAAALPMTLLAATGLIDPIWAVALGRATKAGVLLAQLLQARQHGGRPINLVGYSMGARLIVSCLSHLAHAGCTGIVEDVIILGAPVNTNTQLWRKVRHVVSGRLVNGYSKNDWVLGLMYRTNAGAVNPAAGNRRIKGVPGICNVDLSSLVTGHTDYRKQMDSILKFIALQM